QRERGGLEPACRCTLARWQVRIADLIRPLRRTRADVRLIDPEVDRERRARLRQEHGVEAPGAEHGGCDASDSRQCRQLIRRTRGKDMPMVAARKRPLACPARSRRTALAEGGVDILRAAG